MCVLCSSQEPPSSAPINSLEQKPLYQFSESDLDRYLPALQAQQPDVVKRVLHLARKNIGQPYELYLLGEFPFETLDPDPLYDLAKSDCVTHVEHIFAAAMADSFWTYIQYLQRLRYCDGKIGMLTRNHFTEADWNRNNGFLFEDITASLGKPATGVAGSDQAGFAVPFAATIRRAKFFAKFGIGQDISDEKFRDTYLPKEAVSKIVAELRDGDVIEIVRGDRREQWVGHLGIAVSANEDSKRSMNFLHSGKPAVHEDPLLAYLERDSRCVGIKVMRLREGAIERMADACKSDDFRRQFEPRLLPLTQPRTIQKWWWAGSVWRIAEGSPVARLSPTRGKPAVSQEFLHKEFRFNDALLSWNIDAPPGTSASIEMRVGRIEDSSWSPWFRVGQVGSLPAEAGPATRPAEGASKSFEGAIDVDVFRSNTSYNVFACRVRAFAEFEQPVEVLVQPVEVVVRHVTACLTDTTRSATPYMKHWGVRTPEQARELEMSRSLVASPPDPKLVQRNLPVPFYSQQAESPEIAGRICSPTCVAMVMAFRGVQRSVAEVASAAYDPVHDIYGNWPHNVQAAWSFGVRGYLTRISDWETVERYIADDQPLVASVRWSEEGRLRNSPLKTTAGHLIVITGFAENNMVYVNDPAAPDAARGQTLYYREDLEQVWLKNAGGVAYVLLPPEGSENQPRYSP